MISNYNIIKNELDILSIYCSILKVLCKGILTLKLMLDQNAFKREKEFWLSSYFVKNKTILKIKLKVIKAYI